MDVQSSFRSLESTPLVRFYCMDYIQRVQRMQACNAPEWLVEQDRLWLNETAAGQHNLREDSNV